MLHPPSAGKSGLMQRQKKYHQSLLNETLGMRPTPGTYSSRAIRATAVLSALAAVLALVVISATASR
jgi:hypothetical protein